MADHVRPPPYYKEYTADAVASGKAPAPPSPWTRDSLPVFGQMIATTPPEVCDLPDEVAVLFDSNKDIRLELQRLMDECIKVFADVVQASRQGKDVEPHMARLGHHLDALQYLLSCARPHQARATVATLLSLQAKRRQGMVTEIDRHLDTVGRLLQQCRDLLSS